MPDYTVQAIACGTIILLAKIAIARAHKTSADGSSVLGDLTRAIDGGIDNLTGVYPFGATICGVLSAIVAWIMLGSTYGMWGVLLGWMPAALIGVIAGALWPLLALAVVAGGIYLAAR